MKNTIKYQIFLGSTYEDLKEERANITWEILKSENIPVGIENFSASDDRGWNIIQKTIDDSDIYLLCIAERYGSIGINSRLSWTEKEYNYANKKKIPILAFIHEDENPPEDPPPKGSKREKLESFKNKIRKSIKGHLTESWKNKDDLKAKVILSLMKQIKIFENDDECTHGWQRVCSKQDDANEQDKNTNSSFIEIRKQLSDLDVKNMVEIVIRRQLAICGIILQFPKDSDRVINDLYVSSNGKYRVIHDLVFWLDNKQDETFYKSNAISITNLVRLGLVTYNFDTFLSDDTKYDMYRRSKLFSDVYNADKSTTLRKGIIKPTALGDVFKKAYLGK